MVAHCELTEKGETFSGVGDLASDCDETSEVGSAVAISANVTCTLYSKTRRREEVGTHVKAPRTDWRKAPDAALELLDPEAAAPLALAEDDADCAKTAGERTRAARIESFIVM